MVSAPNSVLLVDSRMILLNLNYETEASYFLSIQGSGMRQELAQISGQIIRTQKDAEK